MTKKLLLFLLLNLVLISQAQSASWENDSFLAGAYGGIYGYDGITYSLVKDHSFDWVWLEHKTTAKPIMEGNQQAISQLIDMASKSRVILDLWPWGRQLTGGTMWTPADPVLDGKDWLHMADDPKLLQASLDSMDIQVDAVLKACGPNSLYGVTIGEEEPVVGMGCGRGMSAINSDPNGIKKIVRVSNAMYDHLKKRYPHLKIGISFYPCDYDGAEQIFTKSEMDQFSRDIVVMDCYPNSGAIKKCVNTWKRFYPPTEDVYLIIWGLGSAERVESTIEGYLREGRVEDIRLAGETVQAFREAGYRNIGWFGLGYPTPVQEWVLKTVESESTGNLAAWNATERWNTLDQLFTKTDKIWNDIAGKLPDDIRAEGIANMGKAKKMLDAAKTKGIDQKAFIEISQLIRNTRKSALDFAAIQERKLQEIRCFKNVADALGQDIFAGMNIPDERQRRLIQAKASVFETLGEFFCESSKPVASLNEASDKLISAINGLKAAYPKNDYIQGLGDRIIKFLQTGDFLKTRFYADQLGVVLSSSGINNRTILRVVFLNPYGCKTDAYPAIRISDDKKQWNEVYRGKPLIDSDQGRVDVQLYLQTPPQYVTVENLEWYGWFNLERVEIIDNKGIHRPIKVESIGQATDEKSLLNPGSGYATIPHSGNTTQDAIVMEF